MKTNAFLKENPSYILSFCRMQKIKMNFSHCAHLPYPVYIPLTRIIYLDPNSSPGICLNIGALDWYLKFVFWPDCCYTGCLLCFNLDLHMHLPARLAIYSTRFTSCSSFDLHLITCDKATQICHYWWLFSKWVLDEISNLVALHLQTLV